MKTFRTKVMKLGVPVGTKVSHDETRDNKRKTGMLLCTIPSGGGLFYAENELVEE
jgi:hypothetical protein